MNRFMDWADDHLIGYLAWAWWSLPDEGCHNFALVSNLDGRPPLAPAGTALNSHLASLPRVLPQPVKRVSRAGDQAGAVGSDPPCGSGSRSSRMPRRRSRCKSGWPAIRTHAARPHEPAIDHQKLRTGFGFVDLHTAIPTGLKPVLVTVPTR